jgi:hypothetical protein
LPPGQTTPLAAPLAPAAPHDVKADRLLRVVPLELDGKKVQVIVEEFREGEGPAKEIQLRILKPAEPGEKVYADPAAGEAARKAEEAAKAKEHAERTVKRLKDEIEQLERSIEAGADSRKVEEALELKKRVLDLHFKSGQLASETRNPADDVQREARRARLLEETQKAHPELSPHEIERDVDARLQLEQKLHDAEKVQQQAQQEAEQARRRSEELQRQLDEQKKIIEELQKKLEESSKQKPPQEAAEPLSKVGGFSRELAVGRRGMGILPMRGSSDSTA